MKKILHITDISNPIGNGVAVAVNSYIAYESKYVDVGSYCLNEKIGDKNIFLGRDYLNIKDLPNGFNKPDLVIFNEVYKIKYIKLYKYCLKHNIPYIIIPHGCLVEKAQKHKRVKKMLGNILFFSRFIKNASCIQFLNENEKENTRINYSKCIISGNGININKTYEYTENKSKNLIFVGRYSYYVKGLDLLLKVCSNNKKWFIDNNVNIELYGRNSENGLYLLKRNIDILNIGEIVKINEPIFDDEKRQTIKRSYAFIQLSRHEGQPMGIIEALSLGVPCIVTYGTSFADMINDNRCGLGIEFDEEKVFNAIKQIYTMDRKKMSINGYRFVKKYYDWELIIKECLEYYSKIVDERGKQNADII